MTVQIKIFDQIQLYKIYTTTSLYSHLKQPQSSEKEREKLYYNNKLELIEEPKIFVELNGQNWNGRPYEDHLLYAIRFNDTHMNVFLEKHSNKRLSQK